eukprot:gene87-4336_t
MQRILFTLLLLLTITVASGYLIPNIVNLGTRSTRHSSRLSKFNKPKTPTFYLQPSNFLWEPSYSEKFGPMRSVGIHDTINLCNYSTSVLLKTRRDDFLKSNFCDQYFCNSTYHQLSINETKQFNTTNHEDIELSILSYCLICEQTLNDTFFIEKIQNGTCSNKTIEILQQYNHCGNFMNYENVFPFFHDSFCYLLDSNFMITSVEFGLFYWTHYRILGENFTILVTKSVEVSLLLLFMLIPEIYMFIKKFKKLRNNVKGNNRMYIFKRNFKFIFSMRHQILFILLIKTIVPFVSSIIDCVVPIKTIVVTELFAGCCCFLIFFYIITLWAHFYSQSTNLDPDLSLRHKIFLIISVSTCIFAVFIAVFIILYGLLFFAFDIIFSVIFTLLSIVTVRISFTLSKTIESDPMSKLIHLTKLKFTRLTVALSVIIAVAVLALTMYGFSSVFGGRLLIAGQVISENIIFLSISGVVYVTLFGLSSWLECFEIYFYSCLRIQKTLKLKNKKEFD